MNGHIEFENAEDMGKDVHWSEVFGKFHEMLKNNNINVEDF